MQYTEVNKVISTDRLTELSLKTGLAPKDIVKSILNSREDIELWSRAHCEYGQITNIEKQTFENTGHYTLTVYWNTAKTQRDGTNIKNARTQFLADPSLEQQYASAIGKHCRFYITYTENPENGSVFRCLLDFNTEN